MFLKPGYSSRLRAGAESERWQKTSTRHTHHNGFYSSAGLHRKSRERSSNPQAQVLASPQRPKRYVAAGDHGEEYVRATASGTHRASSSIEDRTRPRCEKLEKGRTTPIGKPGCSVPRYRDLDERQTYPTTMWKRFLKGSTSASVSRQSKWLDSPNF